MWLRYKICRLKVPPLIRIGKLSITLRTDSMCKNTIPAENICLSKSMSPLFSTCQTFLTYALRDESIGIVLPGGPAVQLVVVLLVGIVYLVPDQLRIGPVELGNPAPFRNECCGLTFRHVR